MENLANNEINNTAELNSWDRERTSEELSARVLSRLAMLETVSL